MKIEHKMCDDRTINDFVRDLKARIRLTHDTGEVLERRIAEIRKHLISDFGDIGVPLASQWPRGWPEINGIIPVMMAEGERIDAVISIRVGLYDDLEYPQN